MSDTTHPRSHHDHATPGTSDRRPSRDVRPDRAALLRAQPRDVSRDAYPHRAGGAAAGPAGAALDLIVGLVADAVAERLGPLGHAPRLVSIRESRIPYRLALKAIADGTLPAYRVGRTTYVARDDEDSWIARSEHRVRPGEPQSEAEPDEVGELIAISGRRGR